MPLKCRKRRAARSPALKLLPIAFKMQKEAMDAFDVTKEVTGNARAMDGKGPGMGK